MPATTALIGLDWGTSALRAYRIAGDGAVIERKSSPLGILRVEDGDFEGTLERELGAWLADAPDAPVIACGMIGSRQGWVEVPYARCPAGAAELAGGLRRHATASRRILHFVPGLSVIEDGMPDVMRGEETQIIGALGDRAGPALFVLPGTHSKWALAEGGRIVWFATFMTGELFGVLERHSILGRLMSDDRSDPKAFARGFRFAGAGGGGLLRRLFSARTLALFDRLPASGVRSYLSGLLIGTEIEEALAWTGDRVALDEVILVGGAELAASYRRALEEKGIGVRLAAEDAAARGLFSIASMTGLPG